ncbi:MAG: 6-phosphogluconolactonase [Phycisphaerae bacterium]|nr:6-phosphogluconolactonase [Phycisphaerae bacterium]
MSTDGSGSRAPAVRVVRDADAAGHMAACLLVDAARAAVAERGRFTLAIPGGSSPKAVFRSLAEPERRDDFPWSATDIFWVDERAVAADHADSNSGAFLRDALPLLPIDPERLHRMQGEFGPDRGAAAYAETLANVLNADGEDAVLDAVLLGIGEDGHVASLFPGADALEASGAVIGVTDSPKPPPERITLTLGVLRRARLMIVLAIGSGKADAVARAMRGEPLPARLVSEGVNAVWIVDEGGASLAEIDREPA